MKPRYDLLPHRGIRAVAMAMAEGAEKHGALDWLTRPGYLDDCYRAFLGHAHEFFIRGCKGPEAMMHLRNSLARGAMAYHLAEMQEEAGTPETVRPDETHDLDLPAVAQCQCEHCANWREANGDRGGRI